MATYSFDGRNEMTGEIVKGVREATSSSMLGQDLLSEGILMTRFEAKKRAAKNASMFSSIFNRVPILERVLFARYFALMLRAGLDVKHSIGALKDQTRNKALKDSLNAIYGGVERGQAVSEVMEQFPGSFSPLFISFVRVGETTGRLQESLEVLAAQLQKEYILRRAVRGGMLYPIVIITALAAVGFAMMVFVVPKLVDIFEGFDVELPIMTRILIGISGYFESFWYLMILLMIGSVFGGWWAFRLPPVKRVVMHGFLYVPVIGGIMQNINLARFARSLSSLLSSGVSFIEALQILGDNTPHPSYANVFKDSEDHVKQGKPLSIFLKDFPRLFPTLVVSIIEVGEETGEIDTVLNEVALFYEGEVDQVMKNMTSIMEPILMIVIGLAVGALAVSVISPIYSLVNVI